LLHIAGFHQREASSYRAGKTVCILARRTANVRNNPFILNVMCANRSGKISDFSAAAVTNMPMRSRI